MEANPPNPTLLGHEYIPSESTRLPLTQHVCFFLLPLGLNFDVTIVKLQDAPPHICEAVLHALPASWGMLMQMAMCEPLRNQQAELPGCLLLRG
jgi:hypothetical protein